MGFLRSLVTGRRDPLIEAAAASQRDVVVPTRVMPTFSVDIDPGVLYGAQTAPDGLGLGQRVSRSEAISVPAVKKARDLICGAIGQMRLNLVGPDGEVIPWNLFGQPEAGVPRSVTMTRLAEDLLFEGRGWWRITHEGWHRRPAEVIRLDPTSVTIRPDWRVYYSPTGNGVATTWLPDAQVIRFDSPNDALLTAGARAIRTLTRLERAGLNAAEGTPPVDWFTPTEGADPVDDDDVVEFLDDWAAARRLRRTAYIPAALAYHTNQFSPEQLQMADARQHAVLEVARITGLDPEDFGVSTTSRTYANISDLRRDRVDFVLGPYLTAIEDRLSMDDVTPHGYHAKFDTASFTRADDKTRAETDALLIEHKIMTPDEAREARGLAGHAPADEAEATTEEVAVNG